MNVEKDVVQILRSMKKIFFKIESIEGVIGFTLRFDTAGSLHDFCKYSLRFSSGLIKSSTFDGTVVVSRVVTPSRIASMTAIRDWMQAVRYFDVVCL